MKNQVFTPHPLLSNVGSMRFLFAVPLIHACDDARRRFGKERIKPTHTHVLGWMHAKLLSMGLLHSGALVGERMVV